MNNTIQLVYEMHKDENLNPEDVLSWMTDNGKVVMTWREILAYINKGEIDG